MPWLSRMIADDEMPMPNSAVTIGSSMPNSEPSARKSTTPAAAMPTPSASPGSGCSAWAGLLPPTSTARPLVLALCAVSISSCAWSLLMSLPRRVYVTVAYAVRPSRLICAAPALSYGLTTVPTSFCRAILASAGSIRCRTDASRTEPESTCHTTVSASPERSGTTLSIRSRTFADSVPFSENALE